jgi:hypothetical protein
LDIIVEMNAPGDLRRGNEESFGRIPGTASRYSMARDMTGTRDRLTHHYFGINQEIVWQIVEHNLPGLNNQIKQLIIDFSREDS